jgi:hypothetical protein
MGVLEEFQVFDTVQQAANSFGVRPDAFRMREEHSMRGGQLW